MTKELEFLFKNLKKINSLKLSYSVKNILNLELNTKQIEETLYIIKYNNISFEKNNSLEELFKTEEEIFSHFIIPNNQKEWKTLLKFLEYQKYRTPYEINKIYQKFQNKFTDQKALREIKNNKKLLNILKELDNKFPYVLDNNIKMHIMKKNMKEYMEKLKTKNYKIIETDFMISGVHPITECSEFSIFPLYYNLVLIYSELPKLNTHIKKLNTNDTLKINKIIYDFQEKFIFYKNDLGEDLYKTIQNINNFDKIEFLRSIF